MPADAFIFLPLSRHKHGSGHMRRTCETIAKIDAPSAIIIDDSRPDVKKSREWAREIPSFPSSKTLLASRILNAGVSSVLKIESHIFGAQLPSRSSGILAVFDQRESSSALLTPWAQCGITPLLLDDSGPARGVAPFVVDAIPGPRDSEANQSSTSFLNLPPLSVKANPRGSILISFGFDDPAGLCVRVASGIVEEIGIDPSRVQVVLPDNTSERAFHRDIEILHHQDNLKARLASYSLLICSYGLTAWEAISAGIPVITVEPTRYHAKLSKKMKIPSIGCIDTLDGSLPERKIVQLEKMMKSQSVLRDTVRTIGNRHIDRNSHCGIVELLSSLEVPSPRCCACEFLLPPVIARFALKTYYLCPNCGVIGLYNFAPPFKYTSEYFGKQYKQQYGRSYLEDFEHIKFMALPRLRNISLRARRGMNLLDIGCAYGPFLVAARESGYRPYGTDASKDAIEYVKGKLGIKAQAGFFPSEELIDALPLKQYEIITLWYIIEHFPNLEAALRAISQLLSPGGILALSTPNGRGISGRRSLRKFLENSPIDHYSIWNPKFARRLLAKHGFRVYKTRITGHHPERIIPRIRLNKPLLGIIGFLSRLFRLGDTFEIYATKESGDVKVDIHTGLRSNANSSPGNSPFHGSACNCCRRQFPGGGTSSSP